MLKPIADRVFCLPESGPSVCSNVYVLEGEKTCCLIDSGTTAARLDFLEKPVEKVFLTHGHFDHVQGALKDRWPGFLHQEDLENLEALNAAFANTPRPEFFKPLPERVSFADFEFAVIPTPGHTPGSVCFLDESRKILFSGDTLFADGLFGRTDLWGGDSKELKKSLSRIEKLDFDVLCPGHGKVEKRR